MTFSYAPPRHVESSAGLYYYHMMDLPGVGTVGGDWDLRGSYDTYLGEFDFAGKRALDMGAGSGALTFEMEKRGARVVSFDIDDGGNWDIVPHHSYRGKMAELRAAQSRSINRMKDSYWFAHRCMGSSAQAHYGNIYDVPGELGRFDVVFYGLILTHLRDPFQALYQGARLSDSHLMITGSFGNFGSQGSSLFRPNFDFTHGPHAWWNLSLGTLENMIGTLGFKTERLVDTVVKVPARGNDSDVRLQCLVAKRV